MTTDEKLAIDESHRIDQHEAIKEGVRQEAHAEIARNASRVEASSSQSEAIGGRLKEKAINEVAATESEIERARSAARFSQVVDYIFYFIYGLIGLEIFLELLGARDSNTFKRLIDALSAPLLAPFRSLMPDIGGGRFQLRVSYLVALIVFVLLHLAINGLLRMLVHRKTTV